jgi:uncharacterized protein (DUF2267 family)
MQDQEFIGKVQQRARLASREAAEEATSAVLSTLAQRLAGGAADNLAAQLPPGVARHLRATATAGRQLGPDAFVSAVAAREGVDDAAAAFHVRAVFAALEDATAGTLAKVRDQVPDGFDAFFNAGTEGDLDLPED